MRLSGYFLTLFTVAMSTAWVSSAMADETLPGPVVFGSPQANGSGCPSGSVSTTLSPDQTSLSILFDKFIATAGGEAGQPRARAKCKVRVPVKVPRRYQAQIVKVDYRGFNSLSEGTASRITAVLGFDLNWFGWNLPISRTKKKKTFSGPLTDVFEISGSLKTSQWTPCGRATTLVLDTELQAVSTNGEEASIGVDSIDAITSPVTMTIKWRKCKNW